MIKKCKVCGSFAINHHLHGRDGSDDELCDVCFWVKRAKSHDELVQMNQELLAALEEGRRAIGEHSAPYDCYATGPITGDAFRDLVQCHACSFIAMYDDAIAKAKGGSA